MLLLKKEVLERLSRSTGCRGRICAEMNKAYSTIQRWVEENNAGLTNATALKIMAEAFKMKAYEMVEDVDITDLPVPYRKKRMVVKKKRNERNRRK